jgi:hypothetical protein
MFSHFAPSPEDFVSPEENFPAVFADPAVEESFSRDGYVVLPFFSSEDIEESKKLYFANLSEPEMDFFTTAFLPDGEPRRNVKEGLEAMIAPRVAELMPGYATCVRHFIVKRGHPHAQSLALHQDFNFVDQTVNRAVHVWITLVDVDEHNGCLTVLPGSHLLTHHISAMGLNATPYEPYRDVLEADCRIGVPMKAGEALFFDERTLHGSYPNKSPDLRIAAGAVFLPKGVRQRLYVTDADEPGLLDILEVESETSLDYSTVMRPPYPEGFQKIGTVEYTARPLSPEVVQSLRRVRATVPAASLGTTRSFFARIFGRQ